MIAPNGTTHTIPESDISDYLNEFDRQRLLYVSGALHEITPKVRLQIMTTGALAKALGVAPRTISKWFDSGLLKGYRIPGSKDRRIYVEEYMRFCKEHDLKIHPNYLPARIVGYGLSSQEVHKCVELSDCPIKFGFSLTGAPIAYAIIGDTNGLEQSQSAINLLMDNHVHADILLVVSEDVTEARISKMAIKREQWKKIKVIKRPLVDNAISIAIKAYIGMILKKNVLEDGRGVYALKSINI